MVSKSVQGMLNSIMQETLTNTSLWRDMSAHCPKHRWVGARLCSLLSICQ